MRIDQSPANVEIVAMLDDDQPPPKTSIPKMEVVDEHVPYEKYTYEEILHTPKVKGDAKLVMLKIHFLDGLTGQGCFATNETLADWLGMTRDQLRNICARLKKKKHLYTLGYTKNGVAFRRVNIRHTIDPNVEGVRIRYPGGQSWHWRKSGEANPKVIARR